MGERPLTKRDREVLRDLVLFSSSAWARPMDVGGRDGSHHSATLAKLVRRGLAKRRKRGTLINVYGIGIRGSWMYRATPAGIVAVLGPRAPKGGDRG